jgi:hypothetical protein
VKTFAQVLDEVKVSDGQRLLDASWLLFWFSWELSKVMLWMVGASELIRAALGIPR